MIINDPNITNLESFTKVYNMSNDFYASNFLNKRYSLNIKIRETLYCNIKLRVEFIEHL